MTLTARRADLDGRLLVTPEISPPSPADSPEILARVSETLALVEIIARQLGRTLGPNVPRDDLMSYGHEGLLSSARNFDASRGVPFRRWASLRIRGAMIDGLRSQGDLPRHVHRRLTAIASGDRVQDALNEELAASPLQTPDAADARLTSYLAGIATAMAIGMLGESLSGNAEDVASRAASPEEELAREQLMAAVRTAVAQRPDAERALLERHYFGGTSLDEAGRELGFSRSWASRLHSRAIEAIAKDLRRNFDR